MPSCLKYIDTCCMMMFINRNDKLRSIYSINDKKAESCTKTNYREFCIPMPAFGESIYKIREKSPRDYNDSFVEMNRLLDKEFLKITYLNSSEAFSLAKTISSAYDDDRDVISPMDALILASATTDDECDVFYTSDSKLISNSYVSETVEEWRSDHNMRSIKIKELSSILK